MKTKAGLTIALFAGLTVLASAQVRINELALNPPGSDNGQEFFELIGTPGASLDGLWFLSIEGDGTSAGTIDQAISLNGFKFGTNGLFLFRDSATVLPGQITPGAVVAGDVTLGVGDFNPDLENGSNSYLIVSGFTGYVPLPGQNNVAAQTDIDQNNDGIAGDVANFDGTNATSVLPWTTVFDSIGWTEGDAATDRSYGAAFGGFDFVNTNFTGTPNSGAAPDTFVRYQNNILFAGEFNTNTAGTNPYGYSLTNFAGLNGQIDTDALPNLTWTPGGANPVPEPMTMGVLALAAAALRRKKAKKS